MTQRTTSFETAEGANPAVDHPTHYNTHPSGLECIQVIREMSVSPGLTVKHLWRVGQKDETRQDLEKALWYAEDWRRQAVQLAHVTSKGKGLLERVIIAEPSPVMRELYTSIKNRVPGDACRIIRKMLNDATSSTA